MHAKTHATPVTLYAIPNCDTVKKARAWLDEHGVTYTFHDYKKQGVPQDLLAGWLKEAGRDTLINRRGPTWRKLDAQVQASVVDDASAAALMLANPSVIKRPVVRWSDGALTVGFDAQRFQARLP